MQEEARIVNRIHEAGMFGNSPNPERIRTLLSCLGEPQRGLRYIHVAGTNGKGSVCAMLDAILRRAGLCTGLFTSPYIRRFEERIRVNGECIPEGELAEIGERVLAVADQMEDRPTEFELVTAIGFCYFQRKKTDAVILEVGLGGRLDPTNVIEEALLSVITGIDLDHTALLGSTVAEIAREKAGILKTGCPCLFGGASDEAEETIREIALRQGSPFFAVDRSALCVKETSLSGTRLSFGTWEDVTLPLLGQYQTANAATVLSAVELLRGRGLVLPDEAVREGLASVRWPARFELLLREPCVIFDGGHNPEGVREAVRSMQTYFPGLRVNVLSAVMRDKDFSAMADLLSPIAKTVYTVSSGMPRSLSPERWAECFTARGVKAIACPVLEEGIRRAIRASREESTPLLCLGSLYLYRAVAEIAEEQE
ncbi:MAG: bifunctional folylpolyglutamate synthase/dihydrofolate synthase [Clostridia bacterium]|nr:bifunctional folylpolyglutamate synthase/dihydrofolate synthase [Clostridia bacterium]